MPRLNKQYQINYSELFIKKICILRKDVILFYLIFIFIDNSRELPLLQKLANIVRAKVIQWMYVLYFFLRTKMLNELYISAIAEIIINCFEEQNVLRNERF